MRKILLTGFLFGAMALLMAACPGGGGGPIGGDDDDDDNATPSGQVSGSPGASGNPTGTPSNSSGPTMATFAANINGGIGGGGCTGCHAFWESGSSQIAILNNYQKSKCCPRLRSYDDPMGNPGQLMDLFCNGPGSASSAGHNALGGSGGMSAQWCTDIYDWALEGAGDGVPPDCFGYMMCEPVSAN